MKSLHRHLLTAGLLASLGLAAVAQTQTLPAPPASQSAPQRMHGDHGRMDPARMERFRARMEQRMAKRLGHLKEKLQISRGQESAWETWTAALKPAQRLQRPDRAAFKAMSTPERIDRFKALRAQRAAEMDKRLDATKSFYAQLTPDQQKTFDKVGMRFVRSGGHKRGHFGHHRQHRHHG
ncbi:MAG TPA: Spy/CpxP family protein refolding chaperone [Ramlibacter sp.]|uniref:Spy/CpxP family protein refolding chaperone n=1 Tax=Ramlibacter sp. TaxID=1917967 RepID=UPI002D7EF678|nr:Spy/CpxP family protein refolding chaperone [Ramlibacter sp.]HET8744826.1 Spy/CpxP family protein refolding chaperone [Ramlibacter sp.]